MFLVDYFVIISVAAGIAAGIFSGTAWYFAILIGIGTAVACQFALLFLLLLFAWICSLMIDKNKPVEGPVSKFCRFMIVQVTYGILWVGRVKVKMEGNENLPEGQPFLLVANHLSNFDPILFMVYLHKYPLAFISKPSNFNYPIAGPFIHKAKFLAIDRESPMKSLKTLKVAASYISSGEMSVGLFPEGTRSKTGQLQDFHDGVFVIAKDTKCPVVVYTIRNTDKIVKNFPWKRTVVEAKLVKVIHPEEYEGMRTAQISSLVRDCIVQDLQEENKS